MAQAVQKAKCHPSVGRQNSFDVLPTYIICSARLALFFDIFSAYNTTTAESFVKPGKIFILWHGGQYINNIYKRLFSGIKATTLIMGRWTNLSWCNDKSWKWDKTWRLIRQNIHANLSSCFLPQLAIYSAQNAKVPDKSNTIAWERQGTAHSPQLQFLKC